MAKAESAKTGAVSPAAPSGHEGAAHDVRDASARGGDGCNACSQPPTVSAPTDATLTPQPTSAKLNETAARPAVATAVILFIERVLLLLWRTAPSGQPNPIEQLSGIHSEFERL